eukprot:TRINITY_DN123467_c0_g1_i1.p1 TRINITY_DN123467_c0_g1~~TRINITY_DN123467_c0_g1_i1.p1  ORF type:complete len:512 (+),score=99.33 TRINITY_DN123467_c0_g1_i1:48-1538(+)
MTEKAEIDLPQIRRLRFPLLGGGDDPPVAGVSKQDAAATLLQGLIASSPSETDPVVDLAYDEDAFESGWKHLLESTSLQPGQAQDTCQKFAEASVRAWESSVCFDMEGTDEQMPPPESDPTDEVGFVCAGDPGAHALVRTKADTSFWAFFDLLEEANPGHIAAFEKAHVEQVEAAEQRPRELVRRIAPCPGVMATFSRHSPEAADFDGCGTVVLHVFEAGFWPWNSFRNVAMVCAAVPNLQAHTWLKRGGYLCALRAVASNVIRTVREYNRLAANAEPANISERLMWIQADLRGRVESLLSDANCNFDTLLLKTLRKDPGGWVKLQLLKGVSGYQDVPDADLVSALSLLNLVETKTSEDGSICLVRRSGQKDVSKKRQAEAELAASAKRQQMELAEDVDTVQEGSRFAIYAKATGKGKPGNQPPAAPAVPPSPLDNSRPGNPMARMARATPIPTVQGQQVPDLFQLRRESIQTPSAPVALRPHRLGPVGVKLVYPS